MPFLLVLCRRYWYKGVTTNDTTAGLGYLEVNVICLCKSPHWAIVDPHKGEWHNSYADFNPNHNLQSFNTIKPPDHFMSIPPFNPQAKLLYVKCTKTSGTSLHIFNCILFLTSKYPETVCSAQLLLFSHMPFNKRT
jgi:hypothetical protein